MQKHWICLEVVEYPQVLIVHFTQNLHNETIFEDYSKIDQTKNFEIEIDTVKYKLLSFIEKEKNGKYTAWGAIRSNIGNPTWHKLQDDYFKKFDGPKPPKAVFERVPHIAFFVKDEKPPRKKKEKKNKE